MTFTERQAEIDVLCLQLLTARSRATSIGAAVAFLLHCVDQDPDQVRRALCAEVRERLVATRQGIRIIDVLADVATRGPY